MPTQYASIRVKFVDVYTVDEYTVDICRTVGQDVHDMTSSAPATLRERFAKNLRSLRSAKGISQERLGELAGFHRTYVSQVERGIGNISLDNIEKLASALEIDARELFVS